MIYERGIRRPLLGLSPYTTWTFLSKNLTFDWPWNTLCCVPPRHTVFLTVAAKKNFSTLLSNHYSNSSLKSVQEEQKGVILRSFAQKRSLLSNETKSQHEPYSRGIQNVSKSSQKSHFSQFSKINTFAMLSYWDVKKTMLKDFKKCQKYPKCQMSKMPKNA